jgi:hypothetical protein
MVRIPLPTTIWIEFRSEEWGISGVQTRGDCHLAVCSVLAVDHVTYANRQTRVIFHTRPDREHHLRTVGLSSGATVPGPLASGGI